MKPVEDISDKRRRRRLQIAENSPPNPSTASPEPVEGPLVTPYHQEGGTANGQLPTANCGSTSSEALAKGDRYPAPTSLFFKQIEQWAQLIPPSAKPLRFGGHAWRL